MNLLSRSLLAIIVFLCTLSSGAQNWTSHIAPGFRSTNSIFPLAEGRVSIIGGNDTNDAIKTLSISSDSGDTWNYILDAVDAVLNDGAFPSNQIGYAVGWDGLVFKTQDAGENWTQITIGGNPGSRNFNGVDFWDASNGVIVGGNESNDAIQTILKTTDGGSNWSVISDNLGPWLRDVHFTSSSIGYAVGDDGTVLKTTDGGSNWSAQSIPTSVGSRRLNKVFFLNSSEGFIVGGNVSNDSITTILGTTNGGTNWSVIVDELGPMLNDVYFINSTKAYAVGDYGKVLLTTDGGEDWNPETLTPNDSSRLRCVRFKNQFYGYIAGEDGQVLRYIDQNATPPNIQLITPVKIIDSTAVKISASFDAHGIESEIRVQYSTNSSFTSFRESNRTLTSAQGITTDEFTLQFLSPDTLYYARLEMTNLLGTDLSEAVAVYTGFDEIPNHSFEDWITEDVETLDDWAFAGNTRRVNSYDGSNAARIQSKNGEIAAILHGNPNEGLLFTGGIPTSQTPDSIVFWAKYDIASGDTGYCITTLHTGPGNYVTFDEIVFTGSNGQFQRYAYPLTYLNSNTPDSLVIGFVANNYKQEYVDTNSYIIVDDVELVQSTIVVPNGDFEDWSTQTKYKAIQWFTDEDDNASFLGMVERVEDAYAGKYAIKVSNLEGEQFRYARLNVGKFSYEYKPGIPLKLVHQTLNGFLKFHQENGDTLAVTYGYFEDGNGIGGQQEIWTAPLTSFTQFELDISQSQGSPDSVRIEVDIRNRAYEEDPSGSYFILDHLSYDGIVDIDSTFNGVPISSGSNAEIKVYPNPTAGPLTLTFDGVNADGAEYKVFNLQGMLVYSKNLAIFEGAAEIDMSNLPPHPYILLIRVGNKLFSEKIIVQ